MSKYFSFENENLSDHMGSNWGVVDTFTCPSSELPSDSLYDCYEHPSYIVTPDNTPLLEYRSLADNIGLPCVEQNPGPTNPGRAKRVVNKPPQAVLERLAPGPRRANLQRKVARKEKQPRIVQVHKDQSFGAKVGSNVGAFLGGAAQSLFKRVTGLGTYKVHGNSLLTATGPPVIDNSGGRTIVRHREYIGDLISPSSVLPFYSAMTLPINPGMAITFPWLFSLCSNYEQYRLHGMLVEFKSTVSEVATNTNLGAVIIATQYDIYDLPFSSKIEMENYEFATSTRTSDSMVHPVECDPNQTGVPILFTRSSDVDPSADNRLNDLGLITIATSNVPVNANIGEIWITYEVELIKPKMGGDLSLNASFDLYSNSLLLPFNGAVPTPSGTVRQYATNTIGGTYFGAALAGADTDVVFTDLRLFNRKLQFTYLSVGSVDSGVIPTAFTMTNVLGVITGINVLPNATGQNSVSVFGPAGVAVQKVFEQENTILMGAPTTITLGSGRTVIGWRIRWTIAANTFPQGTTFGKFYISTL